jgi:hypothetical protein
VVVVYISNFLQWISSFAPGRQLLEARRVKGIVVRTHGLHLLRKKILVVS